MKKTHTEKKFAFLSTLLLQSICQRIPYHFSTETGITVLGVCILYDLIIIQGLRSLHELISLTNVTNSLSHQHTQTHTNSCCTKLTADRQTHAHHTSTDRAVSIFIMTSTA